MNKFVLMCFFILVIAGCSAKENISSNNYKFSSPPPSKGNGIGPKFGYVGGGYYKPTTGFFFRDVSFGMTEDEVEKILISTNAGWQPNIVHLNMGSDNVAFPSLSSVGKIVRHDSYIDLIINDKYGPYIVLSYMHIEGRLKAIFVTGFYSFSRPRKEDAFFAEVLNVFSSLSHYSTYNIKHVGDNEVYERDGIYHIFTGECSSIWDASYKMTLEMVKWEGKRLEAEYGLETKKSDMKNMPGQNFVPNRVEVPDSANERLKLYGRTVETLLN